MSGGFKNERFVNLVYLDTDGSASNSGSSPQDALNFASKDAIFSAQAGTVVEDVDFVVTTALSGVTEIEIGDASDDNGFAASGDITYGTAGAYRGSGAYISGANKYYVVDTDINLDVVGSAASGTGVIRISGYRV